MSYACQCGRPKGRESDLSCVHCWEQLEPELRAEYITLAANKRGSPSYHSKTREVQRALDAVVKARQVVV